MASAQNRDDKMIKTVFLLLSIYCMAFSQSHIRGVAKIYNIENPDPEAETSQYTYQPESLAMFARMEVQPDETRKQLIDGLIKNFKNASLWELGAFWNGMDAFWMFAAHDDQAALLNWIEDDHNCTEVNSPAFEVDKGYTGNGTSSYLNTNYNPLVDGVKAVLGDIGFGLYQRASIGDGTYWLLGATSSTTFRLGILPRFFDTVFASAFTANTSFSNSNTVTQGLFSVSSLDEAQVSVYINGSLDFTETPDQDIGSFYDIYILCQNSAGTAGNFSVGQVSFAFIGRGLTENEQATLFSLIEAYLDAIGAGVVE